jgi:hypothetical protein
LRQLLFLHNYTVQYSTPKLRMALHHKSQGKYRVTSLKYGDQAR